MKTLISSAKIYFTPELATSSFLLIVPSQVDVVLIQNIMHNPNLNLSPKPNPNPPPGPNVNLNLTSAVLTEVSESLAQLEKHCN